jgi:hypothetical protein
LTRDRRGFENTFLMHADRPGDRPRLLYWYRTAPGIVLGRSPLDEDAIRTIEDSHPDIDFDWPAILALSEVMTPEDEAPARPQQKPQQQGRKRRGESEGGRQNQGERRESAFAGESSNQLRRDDRPEDSPAPVDRLEPDAAQDVELEDTIEPEPPVPHRASGLLEELVGREIATKLRARHSEIMARIHELDGEGSMRDAWVKRAEPLNPDLWLTPEAILDGVRGADPLFERLRADLTTRF